MPPQPQPLADPLPLVSASLGALGFKGFVPLGDLKCKARHPGGPSPDLPGGWKLGEGGRALRPRVRGRALRVRRRDPSPAPTPHCFAWVDLCLFSSFPASYSFFSSVPLPCLPGFLSLPSPGISVVHPLLSRFQGCSFSVFTSHMCPAACLCPCPAPVSHPCTECRPLAPWPLGTCNPLARLPLPYTSLLVLHPSPGLPQPWFLPPHSRQAAVSWGSPCLDIPGPSLCTPPTRGQEIPSSRC